MPGKPWSGPESPALGVNWKRRDLPQPRTCTYIFSRSHPSCGSACEMPGHTQPPPAAAALAIFSLCWDGSCYFFPLHQLHQLPARSRSSVPVLGGRCGAPVWLQGCAKPCGCCPRGWCCPGRGAPGLWEFHSAAFGAGQGRADKRLSQSHCNCGFPDMGVHFLWFCFWFFFLFFRLLLFLFLPFSLLRSQITTTVCSSRGSRGSHLCSSHSGTGPMGAAPATHCP